MQAAETIEDIDAQIAALQAKRAELAAVGRREVQKRINSHIKKVDEAASDITVDIVSKTRRSHGRVYEGQNSGMKATIGKRDGVKFIRLHGLYKSFNGDTGKVVDRTFKVGDTVEYDSYNLRYLGVIAKITDKRVIVEPRYGSRTRSMDLYGFAWRNYNFNLEQAIEENQATSMYI